MFPSQMVRLKIVEPSSGPLFPCFPRKWYALKLSNNHVFHFFHVSLANGTSSNCQTLKWPTFSMFASQMEHLKIVEPSSGPLFHVSLANCTPWNCWTLKWPTFSMFPSQMVRFKIFEQSCGPLFPCFPRKWYAFKLSNPQVAHFFHVSLANGTP